MTHKLLQELSTEMTKIYKTLNCTHNGDLKISMPGSLKIYQGSSMDQGKTVL